MMTVKNIENVQRYHEDKIIYESLYVQMDNGELRELCNCTIIDGKLVLKPSIRLR